jgi:DUF1365 family protein
MTGALLHEGWVSHVRHAPFVHRFRYRMWMLSVDLDHPRTTRLFGRLRPVSLHAADHGPRDGTPLRPWVETMLAREGLENFAARIRFMAIPRVFGFAFNPIAFYACHDAAGRLGAVIHQVKNTFGDQTEYVLPVTADGGTIRGTIHQTTEKRMHVSPFFDVRGGYRFAFSDPSGEAFHLTIRYGADDAPRMTATMALRARPLTDGRLWHLLFAMPFMPIKVFAAIHWEAIRLKLRGAVYHPPPPPLAAQPIASPPLEPNIGTPA